MKMNEIGEKLEYNLSESMLQIVHLPFRFLVFKFTHN